MIRDVGANDIKTTGHKVHNAASKLKLKTAFLKKKSTSFESLPKSLIMTDFTEVSDGHLGGACGDSEGPEYHRKEHCAGKLRA